MEIFTGDLAADLHRDFLKLQIWDEWFFCPLLEKFCPLFKYFEIFCPVGVQIPQTVVHFAHFQVQARKRGVLGWAWGCSVYWHISKRGVWRLSKQQGLGVVFWAKWDPIWAKWDPSRQIVQEVGKSALELGKKIPNHRFEAMYKPNVSLLQWRKWIPVCVLWWKKIHGGMLIPRRNWSEEHRYASA